MWRRRLLNFAMLVSLTERVMTAALWARGGLSWNYNVVSFWGRARFGTGQTLLSASNTLDRVS